MKMTVDVERTILIDLSRTDREKAAMADVLARYPHAIVVAAYDRDGGNAININDCLSSDEFIISQEELVSHLDLHFAHWAADNPRHAALVQGIEGQLFEHNLHELHKWTFTLGTLVRGCDMAQVALLLPDARTSDEVALFEAEGEVSTGGLGHILYRRTDFLLHYVHTFLSMRGVTQVTRYRTGRRDWCGPTGRRLLRTYGLLTFKAGKHLIHRLRHRVAVSTAGADRPTILALSRSVVHSDYLATLVRSGAAAPIVMDSALNYPYTRDASDSMFGKASAHIYDGVTIGTIFHQFLRSWRDLMCVDLDVAPPVSVPDFEFDGLSVSLKTCLREALTARFEAALLVAGIRHYVAAHPEITVLVHCELFTAYAAYLAETCKDMNVRCYQAAFGTYEMRPVAECVFGDGFLCFSQNQQDSLRKVRGLDPRVIYRGNLFIKSSSDADADADAAEVEVRARARHIVFYAQPYNEHVEDELLLRLSRFCEDHSYRLTVVLHPRGRIGGPVPVGEFCRVLKNAEYLAVRDVLESEVTLAVTRTSNIGYQLILRGVPVANVLLSPADYLVEQEYFGGYPLKFDSMDQLYQAVSDVQTKLEQFYQFRASFVARSYRGLGVAQLSDFLMGGAS